MKVFFIFFPQTLSVTDFFFTFLLFMLFFSDILYSLKNVCHPYLCVSCTCSQRPFTYIMPFRKSAIAHHVMALS